MPISPTSCLSQWSTTGLLRSSLAGKKEMLVPMQVPCNWHSESSCHVRTRLLAAWGGTLILSPLPGNQGLWSLNFTTLMLTVHAYKTPEWAGRTGRGMGDCAPILPFFSVLFLSLPFLPYHQIRGAAFGSGTSGIRRSGAGPDLPSHRTLST